jgi:hypothetical protein
MHGGGIPPGGVATGDENLRPSGKPCQWLNTHGQYDNPVLLAVLIASSLNYYPDQITFRTLLGRLRQQNLLS